MQPKARRRHFLKTCAGAGALTALGGSSLLGCRPARLGSECPAVQQELRGPPPQESAAGGRSDAFATLRGFCEGVDAPSPAEYRRRREGVVERLVAAGQAGVIVEAGVNLTYLTGVRWGQSERPLLYWLGADGQSAWMGASFERGTLTERLQAQGLAADARLETWDEEASAAQGLAKMVGGEAKGEPVALDPAMRLFVAQALRAAFSGRVVKGSAAFVDSTRIVKTSAELARLRRANEATKAALRVAADLIVPGMRESDARGIVREAQVAAGLSGIWVLPLFGPNAAFPHGTAAEHELRAGDLVLVDTGGSLHGYQSDITRTWAIGTPQDEARRAWDAVLEAQSSSLQLMEPGAKAGDVDARARAVIERAGFGGGYASFTHRLGHGIGMQGHEAPYLRMDNARVLQAGMTMSNEPGIYMPGKLGVRIEDIVAITSSGHEVFGPRPISLADPFGDGVPLATAGAS